MTYDISVFNTTNATLYHLVSGVNSASDGLFGVLILIVAFMFFLFSFKQGGVDWSVDNWIASSFLTIVLASLMFFVGLTEWYWIMACVSILIITLLMKFLS